MFLNSAVMNLRIWAMMYAINASSNKNNEIIISIRANMGNRLKNAGIQTVNNLLSAEIKANGFMSAQRTSIMQIIRLSKGKKNLYK